MKTATLFVIFLTALVLAPVPAPAEQLVNAAFCQAEKPALESDPFEVDKPSDTLACFYLEPTDILAAGCELNWSVVNQKNSTPVLSGTASLKTGSGLAVCTRNPLPAGLYVLKGQCVQRHTPNFCVRGLLAR